VLRAANATVRLAAQMGLSGGPIRSVSRGAEAPPSPLAARSLLAFEQMTPNQQSPVAAPPDDGGHQGSYTTAEQTLEMHAADRPPQAPALHRDRDRYTSAADGVSPVWMLIAALVFFALVAFFVYVRS
jgi:hypothetical protein